MNNEEFNNEIQKKIARLMPSIEKLQEICRRYGIGELISLVEVIGETANPNIKIMTTMGTYIIKIFHAKSRRLAFTIKVLKQLELNNIPALMPIKDIDGLYYGKLGEKAYQVTAYVEGCPFDGGIDQIRASGRMLRMFHDALSGINNVVEPIGSLYPSTSTLSMSMKKLPSFKDQIPQEKYSRIITLYDEIIGCWNEKSARLPSTIIHGDWHMRNQLFTKSGDVKCIFDFDFIKRAERIFDIAYIIWYLHIHYESLNLAEVFLDGYGPLLNEEIKLLPLEIARINYFFIISSMLASNPLGELNRQYEKLVPYVEWLMSPYGEKQIKSLCKRKLSK